MQGVVFVYILTTSEPNRVRFGLSSNVEKRLAELRPVSDVPLEAYWSIAMPTRTQAIALVQRLGRKFSKERIGDWFQIEPFFAKAVTQAFAVITRPTAQVKADRDRIRIKEERQWFEDGRNAFDSGKVMSEYPRLVESSLRDRMRAKRYWQNGWRFACAQVHDS